MLGPQTKVGDLVQRHPETLPVLKRFGFTEIDNPVMRATVAKYVTLEMACKKKDVNIDKLMDALSRAIQEQD